MAEIRQFPGGTTVGNDEEDVDLNILEWCHRLLKMAENGELLSIAIAAEMKDKQVLGAQYLGDNSSPYTLLGVLDSIKLQILDGEENE